MEGYCISKLASCTLRVKDPKAGLNDPIWGGARCIVGSLGLSAPAPLPLTDYRPEWWPGVYFERRRELWILLSSRATS